MILSGIRGKKLLALARLSEVPREVPTFCEEINFVGDTQQEVGQFINISESCVIIIRDDQVQPMIVSEGEFLFKKLFFDLRW